MKKTTNFNDAGRTVYCTPVCKAHVFKMRNVLCTSPEDVDYGSSSVEELTEDVDYIW